MFRKRDDFKNKFQHTTFDKLVPSKCRSDSGYSSLKTDEDEYFSAFL